MPSEDIEQRASEYASRRGAEIRRRLGYGRDGSVFSTSVPTAVKAFERRDAYERERACYLRLRDRQVTQVRGHHVPQMIGSDDELLVIEMTIVTQPFLLDFASAWLDDAPDFSDEVMEEWFEEKREQFGERWPDVQLILATLQGDYGIHLLDINPRNITFSAHE